jgi:hypothetical protein
VRLLIRLGTATALLLSATTASSGSSLKYVSEAQRVEAIRRAQVWHPTAVAAMNVRNGPEGTGAFRPGQTVRCDYVNKRLGGHTPKFACRLPGGDEVKVKYGAHNGEVYAEVLGTRLSWALGFGADRMYPVRVICRGCPRDDDGHHANAPDVMFEHAVIERKYPGRALESHRDSGWVWPEIELPNPSEGGAPRAQRDALKLLASFVQHTDSKAEQQRLVCEGAEGPTHAGPCENPLMLVSDFGQTFGRANVYNRDTPGSVNFDRWSATPVWKDPVHCIAFLPESLTGTLRDPRISEEGRAFLARLLAQLSDQQLTDLFDVARVQDRSDDPHRSATPSAWVGAFKQKRAAIVDHVCPD